MTNQIILAATRTGCIVPCNYEVSVSNRKTAKWNQRVESWTVAWTAFLMRKSNFCKVFVPYLKGESALRSLWLHLILTLWSNTLSLTLAASFCLKVLCLSRTKLLWGFEGNQRAGPVWVSI